MAKEMRFKFGYGKSEIEFSLPKKNVLMQLKASEPSVDQIEENEVKRALREPIGTPLLSEIVKKGETICIITSDMTRPCPSHKILPYVIEELLYGGINPDDITVVFALGIHRRHSEEEMKKLVGEQTYNMVHTVDSDPDDTVNLGLTERGTPVNVTASVAKADRRICVGNIEMHYFAGYSGGAKAIMPGISDRKAIQANHSMMIQDNNRAGEIEGNDIRMDIEEAGDICGIDFIVNVVLDEEKKIVKAVAGDHRAAHREGCRFLDSMYKIGIPNEADLVIATPGGYPKDINLYQAQKALDNAKHAVRRDGIIILVAECREGFGESVFEEWIKEGLSADDMILKIKQNFQLGGHKAAAIAMTSKKCSEILLVSELDPDTAKKTYMKSFPDIDSAITYAFSKLGENAECIVMPHASSTLPCVD